MLRFMRVEGSSLQPEYQEGDFVLILTGSLLPARIKQGDVIVFQHAEYGQLIKRVTHVLRDEVYVTGTQPNSLDSRRLGPIPRHTINGKVLWHIQRLGQAPAA